MTELAIVTEEQLPPLSQLTLPPTDTLPRPFVLFLLSYSTMGRVLLKVRYIHLLSSTSDHPG